MMNPLLRTLGPLALTVLLVSLTACSAAEPPASEAPPDGPPETPAAVDAAAEASPARQAFAALLRQAHDRQVLPDGTELEVLEGSSIEENQFALFDVDGDGEEELVLLWSSSDMAGMLGAVYRYDASTAAVQAELWDFPALTFYESGAAAAGWSHNQGMSGERFWPYTLYLHDPAADTYIWMGAVEAWDHALGDTDGQGTPFPAEADADGDGLVYFLTTGPESTRTLDGPAYEAWRAAYLKGTAPLEIPYQNLTEANIDALLINPAGDPAAGAAADRPESAEDDLPYGRPLNFDQSGLSSAFADAIAAYCRSGLWPDGQEDGAIPSRVSYAVLDIDGDGREELILQNTDTIVAAMSERVYDDHGGAFQEQFSAFPALTYYENGVIQENWSHNQGKAGDRLWPYTLHLYQPEADCYEILGSADGWDRTLGEQAVGMDFPDETDADGDGYLYFLLPPNWEGAYTRDHLADGPDYEAWRSAALQDAQPMDIPYHTLDVETVFPNAAG